MDRRRINGPEISILPLPEPSDSSTETQSEILDLSGHRDDGRTVENVRPVFLKTGVVPQANGSAYIEQGNTKIICAVYGPRSTRRNVDAEKGRLYCEFKFATFSGGKRRGFQKDQLEKDFSIQLTSALIPSLRLESIPKSSIDIYVTVLETDGNMSSLASSITVASIALADAGIEMYDLVAGCCAGFLSSTVLMDPTFQEEQNQQGSMLISYMPSLNEITHLIQNGLVDSDALIQVYLLIIFSLRKHTNQISTCNSFFLPKKRQWTTVL
ncbi:ribosomal protein S5 domain 2-type protein, partial [Paraphysoderma sedebokerense]